MSNRVSQPNFEERAARRLAGARLPLEPVVFAAVFDLIRAANRLTQDFESKVHRPNGVSWAGFRALFCVWVEERVEPARLARLCAVSRPTMSSVLKTLEREGMVRRERQCDDGRQISVSLTDKGIETVIRGVRAQHRRERQWLAEIPVKDLRVTVRVLRMLLGATLDPPPDI